MKSEIKNLIKYLNELKIEADNNIDIYVIKFEDIRKKFNECETIRYIWNDFSKSLTCHKNADEEKIYSIADASEYFSFQNLTADFLAGIRWNIYGIGNFRNVCGINCRFKWNRHDEFRY